jgi:hypothetical protein
VERRYAAILGILGFATVTLRGAIAGSDSPATLWHACLALVALAALGAVSGAICRRLADEAARQAVVKERSHRQPPGR